MSIVDRLNQRQITAKDLAELPKYFEIADLAVRATEGAKKKIVFNLGDKKSACYDHWGVGHEAHTWAECDFKGKVEFFTNWGGDHMMFDVDILDSDKLLAATLKLKDHEGHGDLIAFLREMAGEE